MPFPVDAIIPELKAALATHGRAILVAPPGSGKTTRVPLALLEHAGKVLVLEPRRLAARTTARFMASCLGESVGEQVGYRVRLEHKVSPRTRVELLTEGILTRQLLADPELIGVDCVIFDEFHERSLQADLGLALCLEAQEALRPDLQILVMSATLEVKPLQTLLGNCPIIRAEGRSWPVEIRHAQRDRALSSHVPDGRELTDKMRLAIQNSLLETEGSILAFLPGAGEIRRVAQVLADSRLPDEVSVYPLYGDLSAREQDAAIAPIPPSAPAGTRKVVLATDIAQTSLTIEGIRVVIDSGLTRTSRFDPGTGMSRMVTERICQDAADQRAGRAGRMEPGICLRLWREGEILLPYTRPEMEEADLSSLLLNILAWGASPSQLFWLSPPPHSALKLAGQNLLTLGAASRQADSLRITPHGQALARLPLHPRLGHMVLGAGEQHALAACLAALVSERDPLRGNGVAPADIRLRLPLLKRTDNARLLAVAEQIHRAGGAKSAFHLPSPAQEDFSGPLLSLAWPDRIAQRRSRGVFRLASGQGAELPREDSLADSPWLAVAAVSLPNQGVTQRIHLAAPLMEEDLYRLHGSRMHQEQEIFWDSREQAVTSREVTKLDALILRERPLLSNSPGSSPVASAVKKAVLEGILSLGSACLPWTDELRQWQARVLFLRCQEQHGEDQPHVWPDVSDGGLMAALEKYLDIICVEESWLSPWLDGVTRRSHFARIDLTAALHSLLPSDAQRHLESQAPLRLLAPSGNAIAIDYTPASGPILAVKLQEMFGLTQSPRIGPNGYPLCVHLLSPAGRPLQITRDLAHFWKEVYPQVRAEMRGRYPKHPWPEDPLCATPTRQVKKKIKNARPQV